MFHNYSGEMDSSLALMESVEKGSKALETVIKRAKKNAYNYDNEKDQVRKSLAEVETLCHEAECLEKDIDGACERASTMANVNLGARGLVETVRELRRRMLVAKKTKSHKEDNGGGGLLIITGMRARAEESLDNIRKLRKETELLKVEVDKVSHQLCQIIIKTC